MLRLRVRMALVEIVVIVGLPSMSTINVLNYCHVDTMDVTPK